MWFYRGTRKPSTEHVINEEVLERMGTKRHLFLKSDKSRKIIGHITGKEGLEILTLAWNTEDNGYRRNQIIS